MPSEEFEELVKEIKENDKEFTITPRKLLNAFNLERRTQNNQNLINKFLEENKLEVIPSYTNTWIDSEITIKHKKKARSKNESDPIQRLKLLAAANSTPITVNRDGKLSEAVTLMMLNNYSQLPVISGTRNVAGIISWEKIGSGLANKQNSDLVKDYMTTNFTLLDYDTPLLEAIPIIIEKEFVLVQKKDKTLSGIVTTADISSQFLTMTEPFLILEQIENHIRQILDGKFLLEEIQTIVSESGNDKAIGCIDDLTFGEYVRLIENPDHWEKLKLSIERSPFIKQLNKIREIRNDIMHFDPEGITEDQRADLRRMARFLQEIRKFN